jgi:NADPH:quinone reductase-like Zn-dependent oxidoreductase
MGEALVKVAASAINPSDVKNVAGAFRASLPRIPGRDFAGVVVQGHRWEGREVWGSGANFGVGRDGAHAEYVAIETANLSEKPAQLSMAQASAVGVAYQAAWLALISAAKLQPGETVLVTGALGAVGRAATRIAHWKGAKVIGASRSRAPSEADILVEVGGCDLAAEVKSLTGGSGVDVVLDAVGGPMFEPALRSLRTGGRQVSITSTGGGRVGFDLGDFYHGALTLIGVDTMKLTGPKVADIMNALREGFEAGDLRAPEVETWPLQDAVAAYGAVEKGAARRRQVLEPSAGR